MAIASNLNLANARVVVTVNEVPYDVKWVNSIAITNERRNVLETSPNQDGDYVVTQENVTAPVVFTILTKKMSQSNGQMFNDLFRYAMPFSIAAYSINNDDIISVTNAYLSVDPQVFTIDDSDTTMQRSLVCHCAYKDMYVDVSTDVESPI